MKRTVCILEPSITVKQGMCIWIGSYSRIKGVVYQRIIIAVPNRIRDYSSVVQIKKDVTTRFDGISIFLVAIPNGDVFPNLSYFRKASLLSNSSSFFSRSRSIFVMYSSCFNRAISI